MKQSKRYIEYTTDDGLQLTLHPVRLVLIELAVQRVKRELREQGVLVDPPTYTLKMASGNEEVIEHVYDPANGIDTLTVPGDPAQTAYNHAMWRKYQRGLAQLAEAEEDCRLKEMFKQGVEFDWPTGIDGWEDEVRKLSSGTVDPPPDTPENEDERKWLWLWFCHLSTLDVQVIRAHLTLLAQGKILTEEQFRSLRAGLRSDVARRVWQALEPTIVDEGNGEEAV